MAASANGELPSFLKDNPWVDILSQRGSEAEPSYVGGLSQPEGESPSVLEGSSGPAGVSEPSWVPAEPPTGASPASCQPRQPDVDARALLTELRQLLQSFRVQQTSIVQQPSQQPTVIVIPVYLPAPSFYPAPHAAVPEPAKASKQLVLCPKCGRYGTPQVHRKTKGGRTYAYMEIYHGKGDSCYIGPVPQVGNFRELLENFGELRGPTEKALNQAPFQEIVGSGSIARPSIPAFRAGDPGSNPGRSTNLQNNHQKDPKRRENTLYPCKVAILGWRRGYPSLVKGAGLRTLWRRPAWVQIPPPAPKKGGKLKLFLILVFFYEFS